MPHGIDLEIGEQGEADGGADKEDAVRVAFIAARKAGGSPAECYRAGVEMWQRMHPDYAPAYAAQQAVKIMLDLRLAEHRQADQRIEIDIE